MIKEHDCVVLTCDLPANGLKAGDIGAVVHVHKAGEAYEVEFVTLDAESVAITTLLASQIRSIAHREIAHVRTLSAT